MQIFSIKFSKITFQELFFQITKLEKQNIVFTPNPEILLKTLKDLEFKNILLKADFLTADGIGLYIAFQILDNKYGTFINFLLLPIFFFNLFFRRKYLYEKYGERICGSDLTKTLVEFAIEKNICITIIDLYNPNDVKKVLAQKGFEKILKEKFPKLKFEYFIYNPDKKLEILEKIGKSESKILFSTLGMKMQEKSIIEVMEKCENIKIGLGIGSSFDYFTGFQKRAPKWMRKAGIEWFYRIFTSPNKLERIKRIFNAVFVFIYKVLVSK